MSKFCVSTDSGCDLPATLCEERNIHAFRMKYTIDNIEYFDQMNPEDGTEFYDKMRKGATPSTSQISPFEFVEFWSKLLDEYNLPIVHILGKLYLVLIRMRRLQRASFREVS